MKNTIRLAAAILTALHGSTWAEEAYDKNQYVDISLLAVPSRGARDQIAMMLADGEPFTALATILSTEKHAIRGGRRDVSTCFFYPDQAFAKELCTRPLNQPFLAGFEKDGWAIIVVHGRARERNEITRQSYPLIKPGKPNVAVSCTPANGETGEPVVVVGDTVSHVAFINKTRAYLKTRSDAMTVLTNKGDLLTVDRTGKAMLQDLEKQSSSSYTCKPMSAPAAAPAEAAPPPTSN